MRTFLGDVRLGVRQFVRQPAFALTAVASLALGIGLTTTLFSVVNAVLLKRTPIAGSDRLVEIYSGFGDFPQLTSSYPDYQSIREGADAFQGVAAHSFVRAILSSGDRPRLVTGETVSANYFELLGVTPSLGRGFRGDEELIPGAAPVVVLSHGLWQRQFGGRPDAIGKTLELSGRPYSIVGIAPRDLAGTVPGIPTDFWAPVSMVEQFEFAGVQWTADNDPGRSRLDRRGTRWLFLKGRLAEGQTLEQARSQVAAIFARLKADHPVTHKNVQPSVVAAAGIRFHPMIDRYVRAASVVLLTAVGLVLLIACANVANMLLARSTVRRRELAIRAAIGAGRGRIVRQLLSEGLVLAGVGGAIGPLIAFWAARAVSGFGTKVFPIPVDFSVSVDGAVLAFAIAVSLLTAALFGLAPAWSASRLDLVSALKETTAGDADGARRRVSLRDALVVGQLALSLVLLVSGALLMRGLLSARGTDIGYDPRPVASLSFNLQMNGYDVDRATTFRDRAIEAVRALPGVTAVSYASRLPLASDINMDAVKVAGHHGATDDATPIDTVSVGADYFRTVGVPIVSGRAFTADDILQARAVAIVNETMARRYWPDGSAVGRRIHLGDFDQPAQTIVGVARDHDVRSVGEDPRPYLHVPARRSSSIGLIVRTTVPAVSALPTLRQALWRLEPNIVFTEDVSAEEIAATTMAPTRIGATLLASFGALALLLAAVGLYGVIAYAVSLRTREVGIRMALGAARGQVLLMVLAQGGRLALVGIVLGGVASLGVGQVLGSLLYGVSPFDAAAYGIASALLLSVAGVANLAPALAASRIDPLRALGRE
jgi:predicted permease